MSSDVCERSSALMSPTNVLFRQFVAFCLVFAGEILSLLRLGHGANQVRSISAGDSSRVCVRTEN